MTIQDRKKRELQAREKLILDTSDQHLAQGGYLGLNLDAVAQEIEYSKGTIYQHFKTKEDLVLGVVNHHTAIRRDFFERAFHFPGKTRERLFAIGIADLLLSELFPHAFQLQQLVASSSIWDKCSDERRKVFGLKINQCFERAFELANEAKEVGDLMPGSPSPAEMIWGVVSLSKGAHLLDESGLMDQLEAGPPKAFLLNHYHHYLDGAGWRPLWADHDYEETRRRIEHEVFAEEFSHLSQQ